MNGKARLDVLFAFQMKQKVMDSSCVNGTKYLYYSEGINCVIYKGLNLIEEGINFEDNDNIFNTFNENDNLINCDYKTSLGKVYNINFSEIKNEKKEEYFSINNIKFVNKKKEKMECVEEIENIKEHFNFIVIILPIAFIIIVSF